MSARRLPYSSHGAVPMQLESFQFSIMGTMNKILCQDKSKAEIASQNNAAMAGP